MKWQCSYSEILITCYMFMTVSYLLWVWVVAVHTAYMCADYRSEETLSRELIKVKAILDRWVVEVYTPIGSGAAGMAMASPLFAPSSIFFHGTIANHCSVKDKSQGYIGICWWCRSVLQAYYLQSFHDSSRRVLHTHPKNFGQHFVPQMSTFSTAHLHFGLTTPKLLPTALVYTRLI